MSAPGAPLLALTLFHASHTSCFGMTNGLSCDSDLLTCLLPGRTARLPMRTNPDEPAPSLRPHYRSLAATTGRSAGRCRDGTQHLAVSAAWRAPSRTRRQPGAVPAP